MGSHRRRPFIASVGREGTRRTSVGCPSERFAEEEGKASGDSYQRLSDEVPSEEGYPAIATPVWLRAYGFLTSVAVYSSRALE